MLFILPLPLIDSLADVVIAFFSRSCSYCCCWYCGGALFALVDVLMVICEVFFYLCKLLIVVISMVSIVQKLRAQRSYFKHLARRAIMIRPTKTVFS